jgi:hypothetical protein
MSIVGVRWVASRSNVLRATVAPWQLLGSVLATGCATVVQFPAPPVMCFLAAASRTAVGAGTRGPVLGATVDHWDFECAEFPPPYVFTARCLTNRRYNCTLGALFVVYLTTPYQFRMYHNVKCDAILVFWYLFNNAVLHTEVT